MEDIFETFFRGSVSSETVYVWRRRALQTDVKPFRPNRSWSVQRVPPLTKLAAVAASGPGLKRPTGSTGTAWRGPQISPGIQTLNHSRCALPV